MAGLIPEIPDIQELLDNLLKNNPEVSKYVEWAKYVSQGNENGPFPEGTTHILVLQKVVNPLTGALGPKIVVAVRGKGSYAFIVDALLAVL
jgi:hypothetical protein